MNFNTEQLKKIIGILIVLAAAIIILPQILSFIFGIARIIILISVALAIAFFANKTMINLKKPIITVKSNPNETNSANEEK